MKKSVMAAGLAAWFVAGTYGVALADEEDASPGFNYVGASYSYLNTTDDAAALGDLSAWAVNGVFLSDMGIGLETAYSSVQYGDTDLSSEFIHVNGIMGWSNYEDGLKTGMYLGAGAAFGTGDGGFSTDTPLEVTGGVIFALQDDPNKGGLGFQLGGRYIFFDEVSLYEVFAGVGLTF